VLWHCWLGSRKGIRPVKTEWWGAGVVICLEHGRDLHTAQLMPLPLTVSRFSKIQIGFTFLVPAYSGSPEKKPLNGCVCVCVCVITLYRQECSCFNIKPALTKTWRELETWSPIKENHPMPPPHPFIFYWLLQEELSITLPKVCSHLR